MICLLVWILRLHYHITQLSSCLSTKVAVLATTQHASRPGVWWRVPVTNAPWWFVDGRCLLKLLYLHTQLGPKPSHFNYFRLSKYLFTHCWMRGKNIKLKAKLGRTWLYFCLRWAERKLMVHVCIERVDKIFTHNSIRVNRNLIWKVEKPASDWKRK